MSDTCLGNFAGFNQTLLSAYSLASSCRGTYLLQRDIYPMQYQLVVFRSGIVIDKHWLAAEASLEVRERTSKSTNGSE